MASCEKKITLGVIVFFAVAVCALSPAVAQDAPTAQTTASLNVRSAADLNGRIISGLAYNATVLLEARDVTGGWVLVRTPDDIDPVIRGWVSAYYLIFAEGVSIDALPVSSEVIGAPPAPAESDASAEQPAAGLSGRLATTVTGVNVRSGPGEEHEVIGALVQGTQVAVQQYSPDGWWAEVSTADGGSGWIAMRLLELQAQNPHAGAAGEAPPEDMPPLALTVSPHMREVYLQGLNFGNNPRAFSVMGNCNSRIPFFLASFDTGEYNLGPYSYLQATIDYFAGSFNHWNQTVMGGARTWSMFDPTWSDPQYCEQGETAIACEYRLNRPSVVFIDFASEPYENYYEIFTNDMRAIIEFWLDRGVIPVLATQAHGSNYGNRTNDIIRHLAAEYDVPVWDYWQAVQGIPYGGLRPDGFHLTWTSLDYTNPATMQAGWGVRNLTALQVLDALRRGVMQ